MLSKPPKQQLPRAAIYARVSSEQQTQQGTIESQVAALRQRVQDDGLLLEEELCFVDDGYTGSTLVRPALERLRDIAWSGSFQRLYVHSPDRLARKYAWQVLLVEELQRADVELVFLNRTINSIARSAYVQFVDEAGERGEQDRGNTRQAGIARQPPRK